MRGIDRVTKFPHTYESRLRNILQGMKVNFIPAWRPVGYPVSALGYGEGITCYLPDYNLAIMFVGHYRTGSQMRSQRVATDNGIKWYEEHGISVLTFKRNLDAPTMELIIRRRLKNEKSIG